jgi:hypothetical protein
MQALHLQWFEHLAPFFLQPQYFWSHLFLQLQPSLTNKPSGKVISLS